MMVIFYLAVSLGTAIICGMCCKRGEYIYASVNTWFSVVMLGIAALHLAVL